MNSKGMLTSLFDSQGETLYRIAVKLSSRYGIDVDDVAQELAIAARDVEARFGFVHINTAVNRAKSALWRSYNYGPNRYYTNKGVTEISIEAQEESDGGGDGWVAAFADELFDWYKPDLTLDVHQILETLPELDRKIAEGLSQGWTIKEIGAYAHCHPTTVSNKKHDLRRAFAALA